MIHIANPGVKKDSEVWNGFLDIDMNEKVCFQCRSKHYKIKFQDMSLRGLYSEMPLVIKIDSDI